MNKDTIQLDHGSGGLLSESLVRDEIVPRFNSPELSLLGDGAVLSINNSRLAFSTDSYVVDPIFFPGGSIGDLAVNGTVNDIAMCGATPLYLSAGLILEEGFPVNDLRVVLDDMAGAAEKAGVKIVTGDTKVVQKGAADGIFINTSGIGIIPEGVDISAGRAKPGDAVIVSGTIADHGITVLTRREGLRFDADIRSDTAPLNRMVQGMLNVCPDIHVLRDPTRGGVGTVLNEIAGQAGVGVIIDEETLPVRKEVAGICELLGFDPLYIANEGKLIVFVDPRNAEEVLDAVRNDPFGENAAIIGTVTDDHPGKVYMKTLIGGERLVPMLTGEQLPRIC